MMNPTKPAFEIARVAIGIAVVLLNRAGAALLKDALATVKTKVKFNNADRGLVTAVSKDADTIVLTLDEAKANRFCDILEFGLGHDLTYPPMVYALGEKLAHRIDPGCRFGPRVEAVEVVEEAKAA